MVEHADVVQVSTSAARPERMGASMRAGSAIGVRTGGRAHLGLRVRIRIKCPF